MIRSMLVGLDGSPYGDSALELGLRWAKRFDALLAGLGVVDEPAIRAPAAAPLGGDAFRGARDEALVADARRRVDQFLERFALRCAEAGVAGKPLEEAGDPVEQLCLQGQRFDLIVVGQQTFFHFQTREGPDDELRSLLKNAPRPVVTAPQTLPDERGPVVVAYDGSLQAARTLAAFAATGLAAAREAVVVGVHRDFTEAARHVDRAVEYLGFHGARTTARPVASASGVAAVLLEQARAAGASLLVMGAYGHSTLREFLLGSVTRAIIRDAELPLFLYH